MSFKCSVFGHAFGDSEIEREREEDGSEVVTTIRETQTCTRCGESRVVSENKEVTTLETAADIVAGDLDTEEGDQSAEDTPAADPATDESADSLDETDDAEVVGAEETFDDADDTGAGIDNSEDAAVIDDAEDAEVIESAESAEESAPPITDAEPETAGTAGVVETAEETDPETDDGVILDEEAVDEQPAREPGEWPDEPEDGDDQWEPETELDPTPEPEEIEPTGSAVTVPDGEFHCPECAFSTPVAESSLRQGDFCPECHRGALEHVTE